MRIQWQTRRFYPDLYGGLEVRGHQLVCGWRDMGHTASVLCENYPAGPAMHDEPMEGVSCLRIPCRSDGPFWRLAPLARTLRWAWWQRRAAAADVLVAAYPECVLSARLALRGRPMLYNCVNTAAPPHADPAEQRIVRQQQWLIRQAAKAADKVVVASQCLRRQLIALAPAAADTVAVVPHGVDLERFIGARPSPEITALTARRLLPIVYLGRLSAEKGVDLAIEAFARMSGASRAALVLVGDGPAEMALRRQVAEAGLQERVIFAGRTDAPEQWLAGAAVLVLPSRMEAFGTVLVEAMAAGVPCVSWRSGPEGPPVAADEIIVEGQTGLCAPAFDTAALATCLDALVGNASLRHEMGRKGQALARQCYSFGQMARAYVDLAAELLAKRPRRAERPCRTGAEAATP